MKKIILSFVIALFGFCSYAQNVFPTPSGNVGIGTNPSTTLDVNGTIRSVSVVNPTSGTGLELHYYSLTTPYGEIYTYDRTNLAYKDLVLGTNGNQLFLKSNGNVGIGTTTPSHVLDVYGGLQSTTYPANLNLKDSAPFAQNVGGGILFGGYYNSSGSLADWAVIQGAKENAIDGDYGGVLRFLTRPNGGSAVEQMRVTSSGNVLIGQTTQINPAYKLDVYGKARANEIVVNASGADFVFDKKYLLPKLSDVKAYIDEHQHLPEIPSAKEMQTNGMSVGEINTKLLQKVEELTLYAIAQQKRIDQLECQQTKSEQQEARIATLEKALLKLTENQTK